MQNLSNEKSPSRRKPCLVGATLPQSRTSCRSKVKSRHFSIPLQREDVPGCKQVPPDEVDEKILWGHPDGYFLNAQGQKVAHSFGPAMQVSKPNMHAAYPTMRQYGNRLCHILMALTFHGDRPIDPATGKPCVCHHLIPDKLDYRPANLLCWLTSEEHTEADRRQSALRKVLPDMHAISYEKHRYLQDPRVTCREVFDVELKKIRLQYGDNA